jgi:hypothetical protein
MQRMLLLALALLVSAPADALVFISGDGQGNNTPPPDDPGWDHVGRVGGLNGIYLGNGWMLTANHVPTANANFNGAFYAAVPGSEVQLQNPDLSLADLKVFRIDAAPSLPLMKIRATTPPNHNPPSVVTNVTMIAGGAVRGAATSWMGYDGFLWASGTAERWATNQIQDSGFANNTWAISTDFDKLSMGGTTHEGQGASGDSGGALFIKNGSTWELAGVLFAIAPFPGQPDFTALQGKASQPVGNLTYAADLSIYRDQIIAITRPECANEVDDDGDTLVDWPDDPDCASELGLTELPDQDQDGVGDPEDNCLAVANADQRDSNLDGFGNLCDADFDGNLIVNPLDLGVFKSGYLKAQGEPGYNPDADLDGGAVVNATDLTLFRSLYLGVPGPSGLGCAGSPPCP